MNCFKRIFLPVVLLLNCFISSAQDQPIGYWKSLLPYCNAVGVATDGTTLYTVTKQSFFTYNTKTNEQNTYSKVEGMADIGMQSVGFDTTTSTAILVYSNGNIDLFKDNTFFNIPDFKLKTIAGSKVVYSVYTENGKAYLCSSQGIIVIDLESQTIFENYQFYLGSRLLPIQAFTGNGNYFYAATPNGLYRADKNNPELQNFQVWQRIDSTHNFISLASLFNSLYLADTFGVYAMRQDSIKRVFKSIDTVLSINPGLNHIFIGEYHPFVGDVRIMDTSFNIIDTFRLLDEALQVVQLKDSTVWVAQLFGGLIRRVDSNYYYYYELPGPADATSFDIYANNGSLYIAHGGYTDLYKEWGNQNSMSTYINGKWTLYREAVYYPYYMFADSMRDFVCVTKDESDGTVYGGSFDGGLFELDSDGKAKIYKQGILDLSNSFSGDNFYQVSGCALDSYNNLWFTSFSANHELLVKEKATGSFYKFNPVPGYSAWAAQVVVDAANNIWYVGAGGGGIIGYNANNTLSDPTDDIYYHMMPGVGQGNLPNANTLSLAYDKNDNLWIGTEDGIGILYNASACVAQHSDAEIPIVQYDKYAGYLFKGENVRTIAVDGANRKWVGTDNGVWLLSPDAGNSKIIYRFTVDNSPLPSNIIEKITVDKVTGDVYISTDQGLMCYRSTATDGGTTFSNVTTFPNPVPDGYRGTIAIKGLAANCDVRITDINGQLVYKTTALGGQAVWNGLDYKGHRPQTGVYLIFASSTDGSQTYAGKLVFMN